MCASTPNTAAEADAVHVAVGVIARDGEVLLTRRPTGGGHPSGCWEFPGGKLEAGESPSQALARELEEELGVQVLAAESLIEIPYRYPDVHVRLYVLRVTAYAGTPHGREGQAMRWVSLEALPTFDLPAADRGVFPALVMPRELVITPEPAVEGNAFFPALERTLEAGARAVVLRSKRLKGRALADCAARAADLCRSRGARLVLNGPAELAAEVGAAGVHLTAARARALREQGASLPDGLLCGASCHDEAELATAVALGVDYLLCSPVRATTSHPGVDGMGWERFAALCARAPVPVYALGGVAPSDLARAMACGGQGVAGILRFWHR